MRNGRGLSEANESDRCLGLGLGLGLGRGHRHGHRNGFGRCFTFNDLSPETRKEWLTERKNILEEHLEEIDKQLESL